MLADVDGEWALDLEPSRPGYGVSEHDAGRCRWRMGALPGSVSDGRRVYGEDVDTAKDIDRHHPFVA